MSDANELVTDFELLVGIRAGLDFDEIPYYLRLAVDKDKRIADLEATFSSMENAWRNELEKWYAGCPDQDNKSLLAALNGKLKVTEAERDELRQALVHKHGTYHGWHGAMKTINELEGERDKLRESNERQAKEILKLMRKLGKAKKALEGIDND